MGTERARRGWNAARHTGSRRDPSAASTGQGRRRRACGVLAAFTRAVAVVTLALGTPAVRAEGDGGQAARGAAIYAFSCAVCHGATGQGFAEAVAAFPADYQDCARCHQPTNAAQMPGSQVGPATMAFSLGDPPPLAQPGRLARFGTAGALLRYLRASMPRWAPGRLDDEAYLDVTAHLLRMVGILGDEDTLGHGGLDAKRLE